MPRPENEFDGIEGDVLIEIYENPDDPFSPYTLTQRLNPNFEKTTPEYHTAFVHVRSVVEDHFERGLIRGKRSKSSDGVFFDNLKLTDKGQKAAIQVRKRRALPGKVKQLLEVVQLAREQRDRDAGG
jgi:hypothetical protein